MITGSDPTPEERLKIYRSQRLSCAVNAILGVLFLGLGAVELVKKVDAFYPYVNLAFGVFWLCMAWVIWSRAKGYA